MRRESFLVPQVMPLLGCNCKTKGPEDGLRVPSDRSPVVSPPDSRGQKCGLVQQQMRLNQFGGVKARLTATTERECGWEGPVIDRALNYGSPETAPPKDHGV